MTAELLNEFERRLEEGPGRINRSFKVSRKGCGRGSGEAPRALKLLLLNRLSNGEPLNINHEGGDSYKLVIDNEVIAFTFRVTTSQRLSETGRPWFNASAAEIEAWRADRRLLLVAECRREPVTAMSINPPSLISIQPYRVRVYIIDPSKFAEVSSYQTKPSEARPTALFEIRFDSDGYYLFNLTAKDEYPTIRPERVVDEILLSNDESELLSTAYETKWEQGPAGGGKFEPLMATIDPGAAPTEEIAELLAAMSHLYRLLGGSGISFEMTDSRTPALVTA